jgi:hypothetical protein
MLVLVSAATGLVTDVSITNGSRSLSTIAEPSAR